MDILFTFVPLLLWLIFPVAAIICVWLIVKRSSNKKDQMLQQLMAKNKELEEKVDQLLETSKGNKEEA